MKKGSEGVEKRRARKRKGGRGPANEERNEGKKKMRVVSIRNLVSLVFYRLCRRRLTQQRWFNRRSRGVGVLTQLEQLHLDLVDGLIGDDELLVLALLRETFSSEDASLPCLQLLELLLEIRPTQLNCCELLLDVGGRCLCLVGCLLLLVRRSVLELTTSLVDQHPDRVLELADAGLLLVEEG